MAIVSIATLKGYFNTGDTPTEANYVDLIDTLAALPAGGSTNWNNLSHADGLTVKAVFLGSADPATLTKDGTGEYTVDFPDGLNPLGLVIAGDSDNLTGGGQLTINITSGGSLLVWSTRKIQRADNLEVISDPREEMSITETDTVSAGATELIFTNMNNFPAEGWIITLSLVAHSLADTV